MVNGLPLISVVIPVKNGENYLESAINSVINQDYENFELIIGINPSTDGTQKIANGYRDHPKIKVVEFKDSVNMPENFNRSALLAKGKYLKFLCHDDILEATALREFSKIAEMHSKIKIFSSFEGFINSNRTPRNQNAFGKNLLKSRNRSLLKFVLHGNWLSGPSGVFMSSEIFFSNQFDPNFNCSFDYNAWIMISQFSKILIVPKVLYYSRVHKDQETNYCNLNGFQLERAEILDKLKIQNYFMNLIITVIKKYLKFLGKI